MWLPYQVAEEYHLRFLSIIAEQEGMYGKLRQIVSSSLATITKEIEIRRRGLTNPSTLIDPVRELEAKLNTTLEELERRHREMAAADQAIERLTILFDGKVGDPYLPEELEKKLGDAQRRFERKVPPGYMDKKDKPEPERYGDVIMWFQLLDFARSNDRPLILVTRDGKEDWFLDVKGRTIGPRPELVKEMLEVANTRFYLYHVDRFLEWAQTYFDLEKQPEVIEEVKEVAEGQRAESQAASGLTWAPVVAGASVGVVGHVVPDGNYLLPGGQQLFGGSYLLPRTNDPRLQQALDRLRAHRSESARSAQLGIWPNKWRPDQMAAITGLPEDLLRAWMDRGILPYEQVTEHERHITYDDIERVIQAHL